MATKKRCTDEYAANRAGGQRRRKERVPKLCRVMEGDSPAMVRAKKWLAGILTRGTLTAGEDEGPEGQSAAKSDTSSSDSSSASRSASSRRRKS